MNMLDYVWALMVAFLVLTIVYVIISEDVRK